MGTDGSRFPEGCFVDDIVDMRTENNGRVLYHYLSGGKSYWESFRSLAKRSPTVRLYLKTFHSGVNFGRDPRIKRADEYLTQSEQDQANLLRQVKDEFKEQNDDAVNDDCVENVLAKKERRREGRTYLIKWLGCNEMTWEPLKNLGGCRPMVRIFENGVKVGKRNADQAQEQASVGPEVVEVVTMRGGSVSNDISSGGNSVIGPKRKQTSVGGPAPKKAHNGLGKRSSSSTQGVPSCRPSSGHHGACSSNSNRANGIQNSQATVEPAMALAENNQEAPPQQTPVTVTLATPPYLDMTTDEEEEFGEWLNGKIYDELVSRPAGVIPSMAGMKRVAARVTVICSTPETAYWLIQTVPGFDEGKFKGWLIPPPDFKEYFTFIPLTKDPRGNDLTTQTIQNILKLQNRQPALQFDKWKFSQAYPGNMDGIQGTWLEVEIPDIVYPSVSTVQAGVRGICFLRERLPSFKLDNEEERRIRGQ